MRKQTLILIVLVVIAVIGASYRLLGSKSVEQTTPEKAGAPMNGTLLTGTVLRR